MEFMGKELQKISREYGDAFYLLDTGAFQRNYQELEAAFEGIYPKFKISYSYKTNYIPVLCRLADALGGYAEVVSDMECELAERAGVELGHIVLNGPYKKKATVEKLLLGGGMVNIDNQRDVSLVKQIAKENPGHRLGVGIRCNFEIGDGVLSRFGLDVEQEGFKNLLGEINASKNIWVRGLHCHFASRNLEYWPRRARKMVELAKRYLSNAPEYISLGGGLFGKMPESLKEQFSSGVPEYLDYAKAAASVFQEEYAGLPEGEKPTLLIEPGSALAGDVLRFVCRVLDIKDVRGKKIATALGSIYNVNPTLNRKNLPLTVVPMGQCKPVSSGNLDIAGYTCIESDYLYRGYKGRVAEGDFLVFGNVGSYSVVLKPPFILPNFPILECRGEGVREVKREENFDDIFHTFQF